MALVQCITKDVGGTIYIDPPTRASNAFVTIFKADASTAMENSNATISSISTTLANAVSKRAKTIALTNAAAIAEGDKFYISSPTEWVRAKTISGNSVTLWNPLREDHANACNVIGTRVTVAVPASNATSTFWDARARWELDGQLYYSGVECTLYPTKRVATEQDIYQVHPQFFALLSAEEDPEAALDAAHDHVLMLLSTKGRARVYPASNEFINATALAFARNHYRHQTSDTAKTMFERYSSELSEEMARLEATLAADENQDGFIENDERRSSRSFDINRV